jgi:Uma2 family endonuclease
MTRALTSPPKIQTVGDLLDRLGGVPAWRVRFDPIPGTATEQDVIDIEAGENRLYELVDGVLVEKGMGFQESYLAVLLATLLNNFVLPRDLGIVTGADGMMRLFPGRVRIPDVAFVAKDRLPGGQVPSVPIPALTPDLAVEVLSTSNTDAEIAIKLKEYFSSGTRLAWIIDPKTRTLDVYTSPTKPDRTFAEREAVPGDPVLPGFTLQLQELFSKLES